MSTLRKPNERRLDAQILSAFETACEAGDMEVAETLHLALKKVFSREASPVWSGQERRADPEILIDAFRKLERMFLRNADDVDFDSNTPSRSHQTTLNQAKLNECSESSSARSHGMQSKPNGSTVH